MASPKPIPASELAQRFPNFFIEVLGDSQRQITGVTSPESATPSHAIFLMTPKALAQGFASPAGVVVVNKKNRAEAETKRGDKTVLVATHPEAAMAAVINEFFLRTPYTNTAIQGVHPTAVISPDAEIGAGVRIGPHAFVGSGVRIERGAYIGANAVIEDRSVIGEETVIHPLAFIGHSTQIGKRCEVHPNTVIGKEGYGYVFNGKTHIRIPHQGRVVLGDDVHIGANSSIDRATFGETRIGDGTKFDNHIHFAHNSSIGKNGLVTAGFIVAGSTSIGDGFVAGGNSIVAGHIHVTDNVHLAALSAVSKSIDKPGRYGGAPLLPLQQFLKMKSSFAHVARMRKQLKLVLEKLGIKDETEADNAEE